MQTQCCTSLVADQQRLPVVHVHAGLAAPNLGRTILRCVHNSSHSSCCWAYLRLQQLLLLVLLLVLLPLRRSSVLQWKQCAQAQPLLLRGRHWGPGTALPAGARAAAAPELAPSTGTQTCEQNNRTTVSPVGRVRGSRSRCSAGC